MYAFKMRQQKRCNKKNQNTCVLVDNYAAKQSNSNIRAMANNVNPICYALVSKKAADTFEENDGTGQEFRREGWTDAAIMLCK